MVDVKVSEPNSFTDRRLKACLTISAIVLPLTIPLMFSPVYYLVLPAALIVLLTNFYQVSKDHRFFVTSLSIAGDDVTVRYKDENISQTLEGKLDDVEFIKKYSSLRNRTVYLLAYHRGKLIFYQHAFGPWTEVKFDEIIAGKNAIKQRDAD